MTKHYYNKKLDIPQDADSAKYFVPKGYTAKLEDGVLIIEPEKSEDERIKSALLRGFNSMLANQPVETFYGEQIKDIIAYLEKQKAKERLDRMAPIYNDKESFESALEKAWKYYNESASRTVDSFEDDYIECVFSKGFREGFLYREKKKEQMPISKTEPIVDGLTTEFEKQVSYLIASVMDKEHEYSEGYVKWVSQSLLGHAKFAMSQQEKQKEQKPADLPPGFYFIDSDGHKYYSKEFRFGNRKMKIVEDAQKEQKSFPKFKVGDTIHCKYDDREFTIKSVDLTNMVYKYTKEGCGNDIDYADEDFELVEPQDELMRTAVIQTLETFGGRGTTGMQIDWMKSLRLQPKQEWSKEDEKILHGIEQCIYNNVANIGTVNKVKYIDFLKSLRPQPHTVSIKDATKFGNLEYERGVKDGIQHVKNHQWKPSEEELEALNYAIAEWDGGKRLEGLYALRNDLKKL